VITVPDDDHDDDNAVCIQAVVGVAGGATRAALTQHQARRNNMADVSAKDGSQVCLTNSSAQLSSRVVVVTWLLLL